MIEQIKAGSIQGESQMAELLIGIQQAAVADVLRACGDPGTCSRCGARIVRLKSKNGRPIPFTPLGFAHFADCPNAEEFRQPRTAGGAV